MPSLQAGLSDPLKLDLIALEPIAVIAGRCCANDDDIVAWSFPEHNSIHSPEAASLSL